jgi:hypothetical protein
MNSTKFILCLTKLCKKLEKEFTRKKENIDSVRTFLYEIIENLLPVSFNYLGERVKLEHKKNENGWETILDALSNANNSLSKKDYDKLKDHLINIDCNLMDIGMAIRTVRKNIINIVDEINVTYPEE